MVLVTDKTFSEVVDSPRIRGDGPDALGMVALQRRFSPYSRGWSPAVTSTTRGKDILPVFAGMVPQVPVAPPQPVHSPRIRGDGPRSDGMAVVRV